MELFRQKGFFYASWSTFIFKSVRTFIFSVSKQRVYSRCSVWRDSHRQQNVCGSAVDGAHTLQTHFSTWAGERSWMALWETVGAEGQGFSGPCVCRPCGVCAACCGKLLAAAERCEKEWRRHLPVCAEHCFRAKLDKRSGNPARSNRWGEPDDRCEYNTIFILQSTTTYFGLLKATQCNFFLNERCKQVRVKKGENFARISGMLHTEFILKIFALHQESPHSVLEGRCPAEFSLNTPAWKFEVYQARPWLAASGVFD